MIMPQTTSLIDSFTINTVNIGDYNSYIETDMKNTGLVFNRNSNLI